MRNFALLCDSFVHFAFELGFALFFFPAELCEQPLLLEPQLLDDLPTLCQQLVNGLLALGGSDEVSNDLVMRVVAFEVIIDILFLNLAKELVLDVFAQICVLRVVHDEEYNNQYARILRLLSDS